MQQIDRNTIKTIVKALLPYLAWSELQQAEADKLIDQMKEIHAEGDATIFASFFVAFAEKHIEKQAEDYIDPTWDKRRVIAIEYKKSSSHNPTWYLTLENHDKPLYIRQSNKDIWLKHYPDLEQMQLNDSTNDVDITCYTTQDANPNFLKTVKVVPGGTLNITKSEADIRQAEVAAALEGHEDWTWLDLETTGLGDDAEIMQIGLINNSGKEGQVLENQTLLVKPENPEKVYVETKGKSAFDVHGISPEDVADAPTFPERYEKLKKAIQGKTLATYSKFDLDIINQVCQRHQLDPIVPASHIDLMPLFAKYIDEKRYDGDYKWQKLEEAYKTIIGQDLDNAHNALSDAEAMRRIVRVICARNLDDIPF